MRFVLALLGLIPVILLGGCPGSLSDGDAFMGDGGVVTQDAETILAESCGTTGCHDDTPQAQAGLDLISPNVEDRLVDVNAVGIGCSSRILVVAGDPDNSYLIEKVLNTPGICGLQMPVVGTLPAEDIEVLRSWIVDLGGSFAGTPDGG